MQGFLKQLLTDSQVTHLFLLGDIFDLWISDHAYFIRKFQPIVEALRELQTWGVEIHYFEGNHDLYLHKLWQDKLGFEVHGDAEVFQLGAHRVRVEHGDLIDKEDKGYRFLRWFLRTPPLRFLAHHLPASVVAWIGQRASRASRNYTSTTKSITAQKAVQKIREHAHALSEQDADLDLVISGHLHIQDDYSFKNRSQRAMRSVNLGTWLEKPVTFLLDEGGGRWIDV